MRVSFLSSGAVGEIARAPTCRLQGTVENVGFVKKVEERVGDGG